MFENDEFYLDELWEFVLSLSDYDLERLGLNNLYKLLDILKRYGLGNHKKVKTIEAIIEKIEEKFSKKIDDKVAEKLAIKNQISFNKNSE